MKQIYHEFLDCLVLNLETLRFQKNCNCKLKKIVFFETEGIAFKSDPGLVI